MSRRGQRDQDSHRYYDWIKAGSADLAIAELLLRADSCYEGIAFHCQQCIEKSLKAYII
jgi:HEPN domain-containing protein